MATASPAAASSAPSTGAGPSSPSPGVDSSAPASSPGPKDDGSGRPTYQSANDFLSDEGRFQAADEPTDPDAPTDSDTPPADPEQALTALLESADPALKQHFHNLRRDASRARTAQSTSDKNYQAAEAHAAIASAAIERLRGAGIDVSDLAEGAPAPRQDAAPDASDFDLRSAMGEATGLLSDDWTSKILDGYDQADSMSQTAADFEAAGDPKRAEGFRKQARQLRAQLIKAQTHSTLQAASMLVDKSHGHLAGRFGELSGKIESGVSETTNHALVGQALAAAADAVDETSQSRTWFDRGFFVQNGDKRELSPLGRELIHPMAEWAAERGLDLSEPDTFQDAFFASLGRSGKLRRAATGTGRTAAPTPGDPTSALVGHGAPSPAAPRRQPTSALPGETQDERAARLNRGAFA